MINFNDNQPATKDWNVTQPKFTKRCVRVGHFGKSQNRIVFPTEVIQTLNLTPEFKAHYIIYRTQGKLLLILSKNNLEGADYTRGVGKIGVGLLYTVIPPKLLGHLGIDKFPDYVWLINTDKSTNEDIILEVHPV